MVDISAIAGMISALQGAAEIMKGMIGVRDASVLGGKIGELNARVLEAQRYAFAANDERAALIERVGALERKLADLETWTAEKERYELKELYRGSLAYAVKEAVRGSEPMHYICPACYQKNAKSLLQGSAGAFGANTLACPSCKLEIIHFHDQNWRSGL